MAVPTPPPESKSLRARVLEWAWERAGPISDRINTYMKASGSPDAALLIVVCIVFLWSLVAGYPYLGFIFCIIILTAYVVLTAARLWSAIRIKEQAYDDVLDEQISALRMVV